MRTVIVVPARWGSTRFPGKMLHPLTSKRTGETKPLILWTAQAAMKVGVPVFVSTDHPDIARICDAAGVATFLSPADCRNGTERCAHAAHMLAHMMGLGRGDRIINWQGDAPLIPKEFAQALMDAGSQVATPVMQYTSASLTPGHVYAAVAHNHQALYFSRHPIPHSSYDLPRMLHVGMYVYGIGALRFYAGWDEGSLEKAESLEQLRWLENRMVVSCVEVPYVFAPEVNLMADVAKVEELLW